MVRRVSHNDENAIGYLLAVFWVDVLYTGVRTVRHSYRELARHESRIPRHRFQRGEGEFIGDGSAVWTHLEEEQATIRESEQARAAMSSANQAAYADRVGLLAFS